MENTDTIADRVQRGVAWLDANGPDRWWDKVELNDFNMMDGCRCVLGRTFAEKVQPAVGGYFYGCQTALEAKGDPNSGDYWTQRRWGAANGFDALWTGVGDAYDDFDALAAAWTEVITERRQAATS